MGVYCALEMPRQLINLLLHYNVATAIWNAICLWLGVRGISASEFLGVIRLKLGGLAFGPFVLICFGCSFVEAGKNVMEAALINLACSKSGYLMSFSDQAVLGVNRVMANLLNRSWIEVTLIFTFHQFFRGGPCHLLGPTYFTLMLVHWKTFGL